MLKFLKNKKRNKFIKGFTLIEALVAILIFSASMLSLMAVISNNLVDINYTKNKTVATYLAQEGLEYMRNMRDTFTLYEPSPPFASDSNGWNNFQIKTIDCERTQGSKGCYFRDEMDYTNNQAPITGDLMGISPCLSGICPPLTYNTSTGAYGYNGLANSGFIRRINTAKISDDEILVFSTVSWKQGTKSHEVSFSENLFNWQQGL